MMLEVIVMKQKRKNRFFTFIFSFLPGAAEMYMGFMKNGLSLMALFFISFLPLMTFDSLGFLAVLGIVVWFFGFFHARNYAGMTDAEFEAMEDQYIWDEYSETRRINFSNTTAKRVIAAVLILIGCGQLWHYFSSMIYSLIPDGYWDYIYPVVSEIPQVVMAVLFVMAGIYLIVGKKKAINATPDVEVKRIAEIAPKQEAQPVETNAQETKEA